MAIWAFILCAILTLSLIFVASFAIVYNFQTVKCRGDKKIVCWADWECNNKDGTDTLYALTEYFMTYSNNCLFESANQTKCQCTDLGYSNNLQRSFNPYAAEGDTTGAKPVYDSPNQSICSDFYPPDTMS